MSTIRALDVSGLFWPTWRVKEAKGEPVGAATAETVRILRERAAASGADYVVACCDSGRCFRHDIGLEWRQVDPSFKGYKGHRPEKDPAMMAALDRVVDNLEQDGVPIFRAPGFEADDVIATLTKWAVEQGHDVEVFTEDKDLMALVCDRVRVVRRDGSVVGPEEVRAKFGVEPHHLSEYLAIVGDTSDHVPGVKGLGEKAAQGIIGKHGGYLAALDKVREEEKRLRVAGPDDSYEPVFTQKQRAGLIAGEAAFRLSLRLTTLRTDVPLDFAAVTAPRVPKPKPPSEAWQARTKALESAAANDGAADDWPDNITQEEEEHMTDQQDTAAAVTTETGPSSAAPAIIEQSTGIVVAGTEPKQAGIIIPRQEPAGANNFMRFALEPRNYTEARMAAEDAAESKLYKGIESPAAALMVILKGRKYGLTVADSLQMIHMIEGKPSMSAQLIVGLVQSSRIAEYIDFVEAEDTHAVWETRRRGRNVIKRWRFSVDDARKAKLGGCGKPANRGEFDPDSNWAKYSKVMCLWRAGVFLCRAVYTDLVGGLYMPDELGGPEPEIDGSMPAHGSLIVQAAA